MNFFKLLLDGEPAWFVGLLWLSLQAAILAAVVFVVIKLVGRWIPPAWRALLWFLVMVRVLVPFSPPSVLSLQNFYVKRTAPVVREAAPRGNVRTEIFDMPAAPVGEAMPVAPVVFEAPKTKLRILTGVWFGGLAICLAGLMIRYGIIRRHLAIRRGAVDERVIAGLAECKATLGSRYPVRVAVSDQIAAPALTGLLPARLIVPGNFAEQNLSPEQVRHVLMHELAHLSQGHLILHWLSLIARALHWFNPVIHFAAARLREECELAADAAALKGAAGEERQAYGETILKVLSQTVAPSSRLALGMAEQARHLEKRLRAVAVPPRRSFGFLGGLLLASLTVGGLSGADDENPGQPDLKQNLADIKAGQAAANQADADLTSAENKYRANPGNLVAGFDLASSYLSLTRTNDALNVFQQLLDRPNVSKETILSVANAFSQLGHMPGLEASLAKLVNVLPDSPEVWYDYSRAQLVVGKATEAMLSLSNAIALSDALRTTNPAAKDIRRLAPTDVTFGPVRTTPEFQKLTQFETTGPLLPGFSQQTAATEQLFTRTYKINSKSFDIKFGSAPFTANSSVPMDTSQNNLREFFSAIGVDFPTNKISQPVGNQPATATKAMFYNNKTGVLFVRAPVEDLDKIEKAIHALDLQPAQVSFQVRVLALEPGVSVDALKELDGGRELVTTNETLFPVALTDAGVEPALLWARQATKALGVPVNSTLTKIPSTEYIVSEEKAKKVFDDLIGTPNIDGMTLPSVTTVVGRLAHVSVEETRTIVTDRTVVKDGVIVAGASQVPFGPLAEITAELVTEDAIQCRVSFHFTEFLGYTENVEKPRPRIRVRTTSSVVQIPHGRSQIVVVPAQGGNGPEADKKSHVLILTPAVIDARGMPVKYSKK